jgi:hypothetical protein
VIAIREFYDNLNWNRFWVSVWYGWIGTFVVMEAFALFHRQVNPPLTNVVVLEVPWWVTMPLLLWLPIHFGSRYMVLHGLLRNPIL